jgi:hypothetical protein
VGWARLLGVKKTLWAKAFVATTVVYVACALVQHVLVYSSISPLLSTTLHTITTACRLFYLASTCWLLFKLMPLKRSDQWFLGVLIVLVSTGQFAPELSQLGVPGIWFPFGTGVSRAQFAYALFFVVATVFLCLRLKDIAKTFVRSTVYPCDTADSRTDTGGAR